MRWSSSLLLGWLLPGWLLLGLLPLGLLFLASCGDSSAPAAVDTPTIAWAFHTAGRFEPCGCTSGMNGGLLRRATLLQQSPAVTARTLSLEGGGWSAGKADFEQLQTSAYLESLATLHVAAVGIGRAEVALGHDLLALHLKHPAVPIVCANLRDGAGTLIGMPFIRTTVGGTSFTITSVVPADARGPGLMVADATEAWIRIADGAKDSHLIVLADLDEAALAELARAVPSIAVVVGGDVAAPSQTPVAVGRTRIVHQANHGKALGWWTLGDERCRFELLAESIPENAALRQRVTTLQKVIAQADLSADIQVPLGQNDSAYAGPSACAACHPQAAATHAASRHAHARDALATKGYAADPGCLACHTTGLGQPGGWYRRDPRTELAAVTCESCHGPGAAHVASPSTQPMIPVSAATCVRCHDSDNSPHFNYSTYWSKIAHGKP